MSKVIDKQSLNSGLRVPTSIAHLPAMNGSVSPTTSMPLTGPLFPNNQALSCTAFKPPLALLREDNVTVPDLFDWNAAHSPDHPLFLYDHDGTTRTISWRNAARGVHRAAHYFTDRLPSDVINSGVQPVIAILAALGKVTNHLP